MARLGLKDAFAKYGATLRNVQWSVSAWTPGGALVVSLWAHHCRKGPHGSIEYADSASRWSGPGNAEFRENVAKAFRQKSPIRLVVATAQNTGHVEAGKDASKVKKDFAVREDLMGEVAAYDGDKFVFRFVRSSA